MKHISWTALGVTSIVVIGFILYFILPHPAYPSSELSEEESEWVDQRPKVEQPFIEMYDSLSTETIASFIQDWQKWSANRLVDATDTLVNRLYQLSLSRYTSNSIKLDSAQYVVRNYYLEIYRSEESYTENKDLDSYVFTDTLFLHGDLKGSATVDTANIFSNARMDGTLIYRTLNITSNTELECKLEKRKGKKDDK